MRSNTLLSLPMKARFYCLPEVFYLFDTVKKVFFNPQPISEPIFLSSAYKVLQTPGFFPMRAQIGLILSYLALSRQAWHPLLFPVDTLGFSWHAAGRPVSKPDAQVIGLGRGKVQWCHFGRLRKFETRVTETWCMSKFKLATPDMSRCTYTNVLHVSNWHTKGFPVDIWVTKSLCASGLGDVKVTS